MPAAMEQPKKPAGGGFGAFLTAKRPEFTKACPGGGAPAISKMAGEAWKKMSEADKAPHVKIYETNKAKFEKDMAAFLAAGGEKQKGATALRAEKRKAKEDPNYAAKKAKKDDPNRPKKPAGGAFGSFLAKNRPAFQKECAGQPITAVTKLASTKWKELSEAAKKPFEADYQTKKKAYEEAMKTYKPPAGAGDAAEEEEEEESGEDVA